MERIGDQAVRAQSGRDGSAMPPAGTNCSTPTTAIGSPPASTRRSLRGQRDLGHGVSVPARGRVLCLDRRPWRHARRDAHGVPTRMIGSMMDLTRIETGRGGGDGESGASRGRAARLVGGAPFGGTFAPIPWSGTNNWTSSSACPRVGPSANSIGSSNWFIPMIERRSHQRSGTLHRGELGLRHGVPHRLARRHHPLAGRPR